MLLSASVAFADPNHSADVSISYKLDNPGNFASIEAIQFSEVTAFDSGVCVEVICPSVISPAQTFIAVDSGQGYRRCQDTSTNSDFKINAVKHDSLKDWGSIRRLS